VVGHGGGKMRHRDRGPEDDAGDLLVVIAMFHDIYKRVARRLGVSKTTVGQVVRGRKRSAEISKAVYYELRAIRNYLNRTEHKSNGA
jgi:transcriptional regulator with XRE-family HTH domain